MPCVRDARCLPLVSVNHPVRRAAAAAAVTVILLYAHVHDGKLFTLHGYKVPKIRE